MEDFQKSWYDLRFRLEFRSRTGSDFQALFSDLMERRYPGDFQRVKPKGKLGDHKCDGYRASVGLVFQLYAPEIMHVKPTLEKIEEDFKGALQYWQGDMKGWRFAHNQWRGLPADVCKILEALKNAHKISVAPWGEAEMRAELFELSDFEIASLLGEAPTQKTVTNLSLKDLKPVIQNIAQQSAVHDVEIRPVPERKLEANGLSEDTKRLLLVGMQKSVLVHRFFSTWHDPLLGDRIAKAFRMKYEELKSAGVLGDEAFTELWRLAGTPNRQSPTEEAAVLAVLAFLFEECEIFEAPPEGTQ
jgi:hypothetical protein